MKYLKCYFAAILVTLMAFAVAPLGVLAQDSNSDSSQDLVKVYRIYHEGHKEHLYTTDANEVRVLTSTAGWKSEGVGWNSPKSGDGVYRLYSPVTRYHLYTTDKNEVNVLTTQKGWQQDNNGQPLFFSGGSIPVYRVYHEGQKVHHLTTDKNEYNILGGQGWNQEGVKFMAVSLGSATDSLYDISNVDCVSAIEANVTLTGSGQGYHAKILAQTPTSAVSFGLQFDTGGMGNYQNNTGFIVENVKSNNAGDQEYLRPGLGASNTTYKLMMTVQKDGTCTFYVNGVPYGQSVKNPNLLNNRIDMSVEASGKVNGDTVNASFSNIKIKSDGKYDANKQWEATVRDTNSSIHSDVSKYASNKQVTIAGTVSGLGAGQDWDNAYDKVSGITTFYAK